MTYSDKELAELGRVLEPEVIELRRWRRERCMTQDELAAVLGVPGTSLGHVETGTKPLPKSWRPLIEALYARWSDERLPEQAKRRLRAKEEP